MHCKTFAADKASPKIYPPAIQSSASVQFSRGSNRRWMKVQW